MKAYSYVRFSRPEQIQGDSLRRQLDATREYCTENDLELDESLSFRDLGVSAFTGDNIHRGRLGAFLRAIDEGKVEKGSCLIVENLDRISRGQIDDATELFKRILRKGIDIVTLTDGKRFTKDSLNNPMDLMLSIMYFYRAYDESLQKGKRIRAAWNNKRKNAATEPLTAICPSWLRLNRDTGKFVEIREHVKTVRRIFELSKSGMGNISIAKLFNQEGVPGIGRVNSWHASVIARILINRAVLGEFQPCKYVTRNKREPDGEPLKGYYPKIISDELFNTVQYRQKQRRIAGSGRRGKVLHNLFSHIVKCGFCGGTRVSVSKDPRYRELICDNARRGLKCRYVSYPYPEFEKSFLTFVRELDLGVAMRPSGTGNQTAEAIEQERAAIAEKELKLENLSEAIALAKKPLPNLVRMMEQITTEKAGDEKRLRELIARQTEESKPQQKLEDLKALVTLAQNTTGPRANEMRLALREAIRGCVEKILVWPYDIIKPPPPGSVGWKERRELTKTGWSLTSEIQRRERMYHVYFKNDPNERVVHSHPKYSGPPSMKAVPVKFRGKLGKGFSGFYIPDYLKGKTKGN
ncbi:MAG: recombinase family protein [Verrucomicrobiia bacterium]